MVKVFRHKEEGAFGMYWRAFVQNLRRGIPPPSSPCPPWMVFIYGYAVMTANIDTDLGKMMYMAYYVIMLIPWGPAYLFRCWAGLRWG